jgi:hypothetical protein
MNNINRHNVKWANAVMLWLVVVGLCLVSHLAVAQGNPSARYEVDAKRAGVSPVDKDALPRSREFIRLDSTYYVGYMYEGLYKADKSSDVIGFRNAIPALRKSFNLFERDYGRNMKGMFAAPENYMQNINRYIDYLQIANSLRECYDNLEMADSVMWLLDRIDRHQFPKEHFPTTTLKAWTYHRNRFFTKSRFDFLKNSVAENEKVAFQYCYNALGKINRNEPKNDMWFGPGQAEPDRQGVYHYLALLHTYNKNYDSSEYYYQKMMNGGSMSWNNYGNFQHELANLATANENFSRDRFRSFQKTLREPYYYLPILDVYAGRTKEAMSTAKEAIDQAGSTPGFGWYNIALGRSYLYDGQLDSAEFTLNKAANFREIHIGTTLTQSQYDFTVNLLRLQLTDRKISLQKFTNKSWWYSPSSLYRIASLKIEKILLEYVLINQLSANPERDRIVYDLFCSESTTTFDEALYLIRDFSPAYFIKKYEGYQETDPRKNVKRYFKLFAHEMEWADGSEKKAFEGYEQLIKQTLLDTANEKLYLGRLYEGLCKGYKRNDNNFAFYSNALYEQYPQLLPFSNLRPKIRLMTTGDGDEATTAVLKELKKCNLQWVDDADENTITANIRFEKRADRYEAIINARSGKNTYVVVDEKMIFKNSEGVGKELAQRIFGKGGSVVFDTPVVESNSN